MKPTIFPTLIICTAIFLLSSCMDQDSFTLQKSVFIEDVENPGLPEYSEWGYNTFGTYIDRIPFTSTDTVLPVKIIVNTDTMNIILKGIISNKPATLKFSFLGYPIANYSTLKTLNEAVLDMSNNKCIVSLTRNNITEKLNIIEGSFTIKRAQDLYIDKQYTKTILSGVFNFKTFFSGEPVAVSNGRFDLGIGYDNFYNY